LLHHYVRDGSQEAFAELVRRHVDMVYATALRRTDGAAHLAADVTQEVFSRLARKAPQLGYVSVLGAWLHTATRNAAIDLMISEKRRHIRETEALALSAETDRPQAAPDWDRVRPLLDAAIDELSEPDRTAIVLRYLERRSFAAIGAILRVTEDAARMRTDRALDKLRARLERQGVASTAAALAAAVTAQPLVSAPAGLAAPIAAQALALAGVGAGAVISGSTLVLTLMNAKIVTVLAVVAVGFFAWGRLGAPTVAASAAPAIAAASVVDTSRELAALRQQNVQLQADVERVTAEKDALAEKAAAAAAAANAAPSINSLAPMPDSQAVDKLRFSNLRLIDKARDQFIRQNGRAPASLAELVGEGKLIPWLSVAAGEDYSKLSLEAGGVLVLRSPDGRVLYYAGDNATPAAMEAGKRTMAEVSADIERTKTEEDHRVEALIARVTPSFSAAAAAYQAATGKRVTKPTDVIRYFSSVQEAADFMDAFQAKEDLQASRRASQ
jgi:RNA polymerase sigma factor (sigma-70 family)